MEEDATEAAVSDEDGSEDDTEEGPAGRGRLRPGSWHFRLIGREVTDANRDKPVTTAQHLLGLAKLPQVCPSQLHIPAPGTQHLLFGGRVLAATAARPSRTAACLRSSMWHLPDSSRGNPATEHRCPIALAHASTEPHALSQVLLHASGVRVPRDAHLPARPVPRRRASVAGGRRERPAAESPPVCAPPHRHGPAAHAPARLRRRRPGRGRAAAGAAGGRPRPHRRLHGAQPAG